MQASDTAYAIAFMMMAQFVGIVMGLSISGAIFINEALKALRIILPDIPEEQLKAVISGTSSGVLSQLSPAVVEETVAAIVYSLRKLFIPAYAAAAVSLVVSIFLKRHKAFHSARGSS